MWLWVVFYRCCFCIVGFVKFLLGFCFTKHSPFLCLLVVVFWFHVPSISVRCRMPFLSLYYIPLHVHDFCKRKQLLFCMVIAGFFRSLYFLRIFYFMKQLFAHYSDTLTFLQVKYSFGGVHFYHLEGLF